MTPSYPWKRHWTPMGANSDNWFYRPVDGTSVSTEDLPSLSRLLVLLGGLGMGKTSEIKRIAEILCETGQTNCLIRASELDSSPGSGITDTPEWKSHKETGEKLTLLVDGIDEVLPYHPNFLHHLCFFLKNHRDSNLSVVLGMRSSVWPGNTFEELFKAWDTTEEQSVHELRPLAVADIETTFSQQERTDVSEFIEWVREKDAASMARIPLYLDEVIKLWRNNPHERPSIHKLRDTQITYLLRENPYRVSLPEARTNLNAEQIETLAELIAIHSILSGRPRFVNGISSDDRTDTLDLMSFLSSPMEGQWKAGNSTFTFTVRDFRAITERSLFRRVSPSTDLPAFSFDHHSFAERLAGRALLRQPLSQIIRMLGNSHGSRIVPQMQTLTALLAPSNPPLANWLLEKQPKILLGSDATEFDPPQRAQTIKRVLQEIEASDESDKLSWTQIDSGFTGLEVARELISAIENGSLKSLTRLAAIAIAERCPNIDVARTLWTVLDDSAEKDHIRHKALDAWISYARHAVSENVESLWRIARGEVGVGKAHDKADALLVLLASGVPPREVVAAIPNDDEEVLGGSCYMLTHHELPKKITASDVPSCLTFLSDRGYASSTGRASGTLGQATYSLVFKNLSSSAIITAFAEHWWRVSAKFYIRLNERLQGFIKALSQSQRQSLVCALIMSKERPKHFAWQLPVFPDDFQFLIQKYSSSDHDDRSLWLTVIGRNWFQATKNGVPVWLSEAYEKLGAEFRTAFPRKKPGMTIQERIERSHKAAILWCKFHDKNLQRIERGEKGISRSEFIQIVEGQLVSMPVQGWVNLSAARFYPFADDGTLVAGLGAEFTKSWPWNILSESGKSAACSSARIFLESQNDHHENGSWTQWNESAYRAVELLYDEIERDGSFQEIVANKWLYSVIHDYNKGEDRHQKLVRLVKSIAPDDVRGIMLNEAGNEFETSEYRMVLRKFKAGWDEDDGRILSVLMLDKLMECHGEDESRRINWIVYAFQFMAENSPQSALEFSKRLTGSGEWPCLVHLVLIFFAIVRFPVVWNDLWSRLLSHREDVLRAAIDLFAVNVGDYYNQSNWTIRLESGQLCQLYLISVRLYPNRESFDFVRDHGSIIYHKRSFEEAIPTCLARRGDVDGIEKLIKNTTCADRRYMLGHNLGVARKMADEMGWATPEVTEVSRWILTKDAIFVRNADDLLAAVIVSLGRYQDSLGKDGRAVLDCWERQGGGSLYRPTREEDLSVRIGWHLESDLKSVFVTREAEIRVGYKKNRTDIDVHAICGGRLLKVIVEHKRAHYDKVTTGMKTQLIDRYMVSASSDHGIYLVSWFDGFKKADEPIKNSLGVKTASEALEKLSGEAALYSEQAGKRVRVFVLDCVKDANMPE